MNDLKTQRDTLIAQITAIDAKITENNTKKTNASGDDADIATAEAEAAITWFNAKKAELTTTRDTIAEQYTERTTVRSVQEKQNAKFNELNKEQYTVNRMFDDSYSASKLLEQVTSLRDMLLQNNAIEAGDENDTKLEARV